MAERQKVSSLNKIEGLNLDNLGWKPVYYTDGDGNTDINHVIGIMNSKVGSFIIHAMVDGEGNYQYDFPVHQDGRLTENGKATPGAVVVPLRKDENGDLWVRSVMEYRPAIEDPLTGERGVEVTGVPGGFAKKIGTDPKNTASLQALTEAGVEVTNYLGPFYSSPNRAYGATPIAYYLAEYVESKDNQPEKYEGIMGSKEIKLEEFPLGLDGIVNNAIAIAWNAMGYVSKPIMIFTDNKEDCKRNENNTPKS